MSVMVPSDLYYDPFDPVIDADPYPVYRRLRDEAPLYYNDHHDFYAVSRADDVDRVLLDNETFISGRGGILDFIRADLRCRPGCSSTKIRPATPGIGRCCRGVHAPQDRRTRTRRSARSPPEVWTLSSEPGGSTSWSTSAPRCRCGRSACCSAFPSRTRTPTARTPTRALRAEAGKPMAPRGRSPTVSVRRVHRLARRAPLRRPDDRSAQRRIRRGGRDHPAA